MSSVEGEFDDQSDKWFDLDVIDNKISLNQREYDASFCIERCFCAIFE